MPLGEIATTFVQKLIAYIPNLVLAALVLVGGYIAGKVVETVTFKLLSRTTIEKFYKERTYLSVAFIFALIFKWVTILYFLEYAAEIAKITALVNLLNSIIVIVPGIIGAAAVLLGSYGIGLYIKDDIFRTKEFYGNMLGKLIFLFILYVGITISLQLLHIPTALLNYLLLLIVGAFAFGIALAIGLGLKDLVAEVAESYIKEYIQTGGKQTRSRKK